MGWSWGNMAKGVGTGATAGSMVMPGIGTAIGAGIGLLGGFAPESQGKYKYDPYGALTPEQRQLMGTVGPYLSNAFANGGQGFPQYKGTYASPVTQEEEGALARNSRMSALGEQGLNPLLKGEFPEDYFQKSIYAPTMKTYKEDLLPLINESYAGPSGGGYFGSARGGAVAKSARDIGDTLASQRADLGWKAQQNIPNAVAAANSLSQTEQQIQSLPRLVKDANLQGQYNEWVRTRPENATNLNAALNFLDISAGTTEYEPGNNIMDTISGVTNQFVSMMQYQKLIDAIKSRADSTDINKIDNSPIDVGINNPYSGSSVNSLLGSGNTGSNLGTGSYMPSYPIGGAGSMRSSIPIGGYASNVASSTNPSLQTGNLAKLRALQMYQDQSYNPYVNNNALQRILNY